MRKNLVSSRLSYENFVYDEPFEEKIYNKQLSEPINKNTVFVISKRNSKSLQRVNAIVDSVKDKGFKVFILNHFKEKFNDVSYVQAVEKNSEEYYYALATSQYIYADTFFYPSFIKRKGQIFINNINAKPTDIKSRIDICSADNKSDYLISKKNQGRKITFESFLSGLANRELVNKVRKTKKKKLLFFVNLKCFDNLFCTFENIVQWLDFKKYDVTMIFAQSFLDEYGERINSIDSRVRILTQSGSPFCNEEEKKRFAFLRDEFYYIKKPRKIKSFIPKNIFENEIKRLFGNESFDYIINMKFDAFYWKALIDFMPGEKYYFDLFEYTDENAPRSAGRALSAGKNDKILFLTQDKMSNAIQFNKKVFRKKSELMPYVPINAPSEKNEAVKTEINGKQYYIVSKYKMKSLDSYSILTIPCFDDGSIAYTVLEGSMTSKTALGFVSKLSEKEEELFVFDFYGVLSKDESLAENVHYYASRDVYNSLLPHLGACYLNCEDKGICYEAKLFNKNVIIL